MKVILVDQSYFGLLYDVQFSAALADTGADVKLVGRPLRRHEEVSSSGFQMLPLFYGFGERLPQQLKQLARSAKGFEHARGMAALEALVRRERPDVVHFQWIVLPLIDRFFLARLARLAPLVLTMHNTVPWHGSSSSTLMLRGYEAALRCFEHFIPHTQGTRDYLLSMGVPLSQIDLLQHPAVRLPRVPDATAKAEARGPGAPVEILFFGSIKLYKGVDVLVRAGLELAKRRRNFRSHHRRQGVFRSLPLEADIARAGVSNLFHIQSRHQSELELSAKLESTDLVVFPYREIDASGAFACASQFGKPILATNLGVFAEQPARDHIRLVPPENAEALADALDDLIENNSARAILAERSAALRGVMYSWENFASDCLSIYERLAALRRLRTHPESRVG